MTSSSILWNSSGSLGSLPNMTSSTPASKSSPTRSITYPAGPATVPGPIASTKSLASDSIVGESHGHENSMPYL